MTVTTAKVIRLTHEQYSRVLHAATVDQMKAALGERLFNECAEFTRSTGDPVTVEVIE